jgi:hypothetical protein
MSLRSIAVPAPTAILLAARGGMASTSCPSVGAARTAQPNAGGGGNRGFDRTVLVLGRV